MRFFNVFNRFNPKHKTIKSTKEYKTTKRTMPTKLHKPTMWFKLAMQNKFAMLVELIKLNVWNKLAMWFKLFELAMWVWKACWGHRGGHRFAAGMTTPWGHRFRTQIISILMPIQLLALLLICSGCKSHRTSITRHNEVDYLREFRIDSTRVVIDHDSRLEWDEEIVEYITTLDKSRIAAIDTSQAVKVVHRHIVAHLSDTTTQRAVNTTSIETHVSSESSTESSRESHTQPSCTWWSRGTIFIALAVILSLIVPHLGKMLLKILIDKHL